jgi:hypothetical protein
MNVSNEREVLKIMRIVITQETEIDEYGLAQDLAGYLFDALCEQGEDEDVAENIVYGENEIQRLAILNKVGEIWRNGFLKAVTDKGISLGKDV